MLHTIAPDKCEHASVCSYVLGCEQPKSHRWGTWYSPVKKSQLTNQATSAVTFDSSDSFIHIAKMLIAFLCPMCHHLLNNGERRFTEKVIHVQEMDFMGTASKNLSREV